jgi:FixJ family two-component response regulator
MDCGLRAGRSLRRGQPSLTLWWWIILTEIRRKKIVAVIDDDPGVRRSVQGLLSAFEYTTYTFDSAEAFLNVAPASKADCLVVDVQLGDVSGVEMVRQLLAMGLKFPAIFMSGAEDEIMTRQAMELGCFAYLRKPFTADALLEAIIKSIG